MTTLQPQSNNLSEHDLELLSAYLDNQLVVTERAAFEKRLQVEPQLRAELEDLRATTALLRELPVLTPPRSFTLDPAMAPRPAWSFPWRLSLQLGGGLAGLALVALLSLRLLLSGSGGMAMAPAPAAVPAPQPTTAVAVLAQATAPAPPMAEAAAQPANDALHRESPASGVDQAAGASESTLMGQAETEAGAATAPTEVVGATESSSPGTVQLQPAEPLIEPASKETVQPLLSQELIFGLLIGGGVGVLALVIIAIFLARGRSL